MRWITIFRMRLRSLVRRGKVEQELDEELRYHLEREAAQGDARSHGVDIEQRKEECRDMRGVNWTENLARDCRYAWRGLRRNPGFAVLAVLVMALGIGANTAVFSLMNGVLLKPLAYRNADRIVTLTTAFRNGEKYNVVALPDFQDWRAQSTAFSKLACYRSREQPVEAGAATEYARVARVSSEFFATLGIEPVAGRLFTAEENRTGDAGTVVISYAYWQTHFGGIAEVVGKKLRVGDGAVTVVGVLPAHFHFPDDCDIWCPLDPVDRTLPRTSMSFLVIGRLKPGFPLAEAQAQISTIAARLERRYPDSNKGRGATVTGMRDAMVRNVRLTIYLLFGAVCLVLLIACANVATLLATKATARTREMAIRAAIGAGRGRIIGQLLTESLLLAALAGAAGLAAASAGLKALIALAPADVPRLAEAAIDGRVLAFTLGVSLACSLVFGLAPVFYAARIDVSDALKQSGGRVVSPGRSYRLREWLVIGEVALAVVLFAGAGLLIRSLVALNHVALGFRPERVLVMKASVPGWGPETDRRGRKFFKQLLDDIRSMTGVEAAGGTMAPPGDVESSGGYWIDHLPEHTQGGAPEAVFSVVTPGTFGALGIPVKRGRDFGEQDTADAPNTVVINESLARKAFPGQDPIGRSMFAGFDSSKPMRIIGVVGDVRQYGPEHAPGEEIYMPYEQHTLGAGTTLSVVVRTTGAPEMLADTLRRRVGRMAPDVPLKFTTMEASLYDEVAVPRFRTLLLATLAALALCLAMAGVYGVTAYVVGQRASEIGLRMAMGATPGDVLRLFLGQGLRLAGAGMALGFVGALAATRSLGSMLFEVTPNDPATYLAVAALLGLLVIAAVWAPARRAARLDPLAALREE